MSFQATAWAVRQRDLTSGAKLLLLVLANTADRHGVGWSSRASQAEECCCRSATITQNMKRLEEDGFVARVHRLRPNGSRTSDWFILAPEAADRGEMIDAPRDEYTEEEVLKLARKGGTENAPRGGTETVQGGVRFSGGPEPVIRTTSKSEDLEDARGQQTELLPDPLVAAFKAWFSGQVAERRAGVPPTQSAEWDAAASKLLKQPRDELKAAIVWGLDRQWWFRKIKTLPLLARNYPDLRAEWAAASAQEAQRQSRRPFERPEVVPVSVSYESDRLEVRG